MWFDNWAEVARVLLVGSAAYAVLVLILRVSGKRTLSQLNVFDFVVTVAFGSTLATILLNANVSWAEGAAALGLLAGLQYMVAFVSSRWPASRQALTSRPVLLFRDGRIQESELRRNRLTESEVLQAVRMQGNGDLSQIAAIVLETNGKLSIIPAGKYGNGSALGDVVGPAHN